MGYKQPQLTALYQIKLTPRLKRVMDGAYREVLQLARLKSGDPRLEGLQRYPELEEMCDALFLLRARLLKTRYMDGFEDGTDALLVEFG